MKIKERLFTVAIALPLIQVFAPESAAQNTREENLIKAAYAKLMIYNKAYQIDRAVEQKTYVGATDYLQIKISKFHTGPIEDILHRPLSEVATQATGEVIQLTNESYGVTDEPDHIVYHAGWAGGSVPFEDWKVVTVGEMLSRARDQFADVGKYTTYEVTVRLQEKEKIYRALALYHEPFQSVSSSNPELLDMVFGPGEMTKLVAESRMPVISPWDKYKKSSFYAQQVEASKKGETVVQPEFFGQCPDGYFYDGGSGGGLTGWCCNTSTMHCCHPNPETGPLSCCYSGQYSTGPEPKSEAMEKYISSCVGGIDPGEGDPSGDENIPACESRRVDFDPNEDSSPFSVMDHAWGGHWAFAKFKGYCEYDIECRVRCRTEWYGNPAHGRSESGRAWAYYHVPFTATKNHPTDATQVPRGQPGGATLINCGRGYAIVWKLCILPLCTGNIKLEWNGNGFTSITNEADPWTYGPARECTLAPPPE